MSEGKKIKSLAELIATAKTISEIAKKTKCRDLWNMLCCYCIAKCELEGTIDFDEKWVSLPNVLQLIKVIKVEILDEGDLNE